MKRALVTGGAGFVGASLARRLLRDGHDVHLLVRPGSDLWRLAELRGDARLHEASLEDADGLRRAVRDARPDWIFHLAAHGAYAWQTDAERMIRTNVGGLVHLVDAAAERGFQALVNAGSSSEYGFRASPPREDEPLAPNSLYAVTKAAATHLCRFTALARGLRMPTLRLYSVYGPWEEPGRLMPALVLHGLERKLPPLASPTTAHDFVEVEDVVDAFVRAASEPGDGPDAIYNVGTGVQTSLERLVGIARAVLGIPEQPAWGSMPARPWDTASWVADPGRIGTALGWKATRSVEEGIAGLASWLAAHPEHHERYRRGASR